VPVDLQDFVRSIVHHHIACGGSAVSCYQDSVRKLEGKNGGRYRFYNRRLSAYSRLVSVYSRLVSVYSRLVSLEMLFFS
jgi:hypothetical protein